MLKETYGIHSTGGKMSYVDLGLNGSGTQVRPLEVINVVVNSI